MDSMLSYQVAGRQGHSTTILGRTLTASTLAELTVKYEAERSRASQTAGRLVSHAEMRSGVTRPPMPVDEARDARRAAILLEHQTKPVGPTVEQRLLAHAKQKVDDERRKGLTRAQVMLEDATLAATAAEERAADDARREATRLTPAYLSTHAKLVDLVFCASFDASVSAGQLAALQGELESLETSQDITATRANLRTIQVAIAAQIEVESATLKASQDAIAARRAALGQGLVFDDVGVETLGETPYVALTIGSDIRKVTKARFDARESDESLRDSLFGASNE